MKRIFPALLVLLGLFSPLPAQTDPGAAQDAMAERRKLLRAADETDALQAASDAQAAQIATLKQDLADTKAALDQVRADLAALKTDNASLRDALQKMDADRAEERKVLLAEVGKIVADATKHEEPPAAPKPPAKKEPKPTAADTTDGDASEDGFDYVVTKGDTLHAIAAAYAEHGVHVTVADIRAANHLSKTDSIHVGQKLFIPKK